MMLTSREAVVNYMTPLGLAHIMATGPPLRPGAVGEQRRAPGLVADVLPPRRHARHRLRPDGDGQQRGCAVLPAGARSLCRRRRSRLGAALVPPRRLEIRSSTGGTLWEELARHYYAGVDSVRVDAADVGFA